VLKLLLYGSGVYEFELSIGGSAEAPPTLKSQPNIIPVAQTFIINDDPISTKDEYSYLAAIPAANYIEGDERYVSPIIYQGVDIVPNWFTSIDDTTQYLINDWNSYLSRHGITSEEYIIDSDPIQAAANIALDKWSSTDTAVLTIDGSSFSDEINNILDEDSSLSSTKEISSYRPDDLKELVPGAYSAITFIGSQWGAIHVIAEGESFSGDTMILTPRYESLMADWWPHDSDVPGGDKDTFFPVTEPGIWIPQVTSNDGLDEMKVIKYSGNRHEINVENSESTLEVTISTESESQLVIFLIDPEGNIRRRMVVIGNMMKMSIDIGLLNLILNILLN